MPSSPIQAFNFLAESTGSICSDINTFTAEVFKTRGGRMGSGMGSLLESLWGYYANRKITEQGKQDFEIAWLEDNEYNDFACVFNSGIWDPVTKEGELFRIEAKSMNLMADESKAHFDQLQKNLGDQDMLLVLVWQWLPTTDGIRVNPKIKDYFIGKAKEIAQLRDALHIARGGSFIVKNSCPDGCAPNLCQHDGEPLNASGKRERVTGPSSCRPSQTVSFAANFGGLIRMLKTNSDTARQVMRKIRKENDTAHAYISFVHRMFPNEEKNQYLNQEWKKVAKTLGEKDIQGGNLNDLLTNIRSKPNYQEILRQF